MNNLLPKFVPHNLILTFRIPASHSDDISFKTAYYLLDFLIIKISFLKFSSGI
jgi:hypothetical protein